MIGLALIGTVAVITQSMGASVNRQIDDGIDFLARRREPGTSCSNTLPRGCTIIAFMRVELGEQMGDPAVALGPGGHHPAARGNCGFRVRAQRSIGGSPLRRYFFHRLQSRAKLLKRTRGSLRCSIGLPLMHN